MGDYALRIRDHLLGVVYRALGCARVEGYQETLLHVDGIDAHGGREEQEQVADQLHDCELCERRDGVQQMFERLVIGD